MNDIKDISVSSPLLVLIKSSVSVVRRMVEKTLKEKDHKLYIKHLTELSSGEHTKELIPDTSGLHGSSVESVESILLPLVSCIEVIQKRNPLLTDFPNLITPSVNDLLCPPAVVGSVCRSVLDLERYIDYNHPVWKDDSDSDRLGFHDHKDDDDEDDEDDEEEETEESRVATSKEELDNETFEIYCKCRQFIDAAGGFLSPEEKEVLQKILERSEGEGFRKDYNQLLNPQERAEGRDSEIKTLVLPLDFFDNTTYFNPEAPIIGGLSDTILKGGGQRFALMIDTLASRSFGYIDPRIGNKRLLVSRLTGRTLPTIYSRIIWNEKKTRSVSETEKVMLWMTNFLFGGGYDRAYDILNLERTIKPGQETANLKNADKVFRSRIESLYRKV